MFWRFFYYARFSLGSFFKSQNGLVYYHHWKIVLWVFWHYVNSSVFRLQKIVKFFFQYIYCWEFLDFSKSIMVVVLIFATISIFVKFNMIYTKKGLDLWWKLIHSHSLLLIRKKISKFSAVNSLAKNQSSIFFWITVT